MSVVAEPAPASQNVAKKSTAHYCTSLVNRASDLLWELRLGIRTQGCAASPFPDAHPYGFLSYHTYFAILDSLKLSRNDVVVDLGCGKGRICCAAAQYDIRESIGVEIDPQLAAAAQDNGLRMRRRRAPLRIVADSAVALDYDPVSVIVMFHPFGRDTMAAVMDRLEDSLARRPRPLRIVYANPLFDDVLAERPWLERYAVWNPGSWSRIKFPVYFYRSR